MSLHLLMFIKHFRFYVVQNPKIHQHDAFNFEIYAFLQFSEVYIKNSVSKISNT